MGRRNRKGRDIDGIVVVDKPTGVSSNHVLQQVKRLFDAKKAGHTGNLDPLASGVLPICLGEATKVSSYLLDADKAYDVTGQLGQLRDTGDAEGEVVEEKPIPVFTEADLAHVITDFIGEQDQVPPMFSALKYQGQPLYKLARQGIEIERKSRRITIYDIQIKEVTTDTFTLSVKCSKGTYIRTLVEDISAALGTVGYVSMLRRTDAAGYALDDALPLDELKAMQSQGLAALDEQLHTTESALADWPEVHLDEAGSEAMRFGRSVTISDEYLSANVRLFNVQSQFIGLGEMTADGVVKPKRLFSHYVSS